MSCQLIRRAVRAGGWTFAESFPPQPLQKDAKVDLVQSRGQHVCVGEKDELPEGNIRHTVASTRVTQGNGGWRSIEWPGDGKWDENKVRS